MAYTLENIVTTARTPITIPVRVNKDYQFMTENALKCAIDAIFNVHCLFHFGFTFRADFNFPFSLVYFSTI